MFSINFLLFLFKLIFVHACVSVFKTAEVKMDALKLNVIAWMDDLICASAKTLNIWQFLSGQ